MAVGISIVSRDFQTRLDAQDARSEEQLAQIASDMHAVRTARPVPPEATSGLPGLEAVVETINAILERLDSLEARMAARSYVVGQQTTYTDAAGRTLRYQTATGAIHAIAAAEDHQYASVKQSLRISRKLDRLHAISAQRGKVLTQDVVLLNMLALPCPTNPAKTVYRAIMDGEVS